MRHALKRMVDNEVVVANGDRYCIHPTEILAIMADGAEKKPKADICAATRDVRYGPQTDIGRLRISQNGFTGIGAMPVDAS